MKKNDLIINVVDTVSNGYIHDKRLLKEEALGIIVLSEDEHRMCQRIVAHIEILVSYLDEKDRFIIDNEVLQGKKGTWYLDYYSVPTYYRHKNHAYEVFYKLLNS